MASVAFIGLGHMGGPMAITLHRAGHRLSAFDLSPGAMEHVASAGARPCTSVADAVASVDAVITMVPSGAAVSEIYLGPGGVFDSAVPGTLLIDCSTIAVGEARDLIARAGAAGFPMVDAPVSGGIGGASAGTLTIMVGGEPGAFERAEPILKSMGNAIVHAGGPGNGQAAKICNNLILGVSMIAVSEAFTLAESLGLGHQALFDIASKSSGQCWSLTSYCPVPGPVPSSPANNAYAPGFTVAMMLKDLNLAEDAARMSGANAPLTGNAASLFGLFAGQGHGDLDFSAIVTFLRRKR